MTAAGGAGDGASRHGAPGVTSRHLVSRASVDTFAAPGGWAAGAKGFRRRTCVDEHGPAVHTGFGVCALEPGGTVPAHVHAYEESVYVLDGEVALTTPDATVLLRPGDYALLPVGVPHAWHHPGSGAAGREGTGDAGEARWADMLAPQPRARHGDDTWLVPPLPEREPVPLDVRDPRTRAFGNITPEHMDPGRQSQSLLAVSASMRTALLVYSGITVKPMVDSDLGAVLSTMFMVQYEPSGLVGGHDHPFEETYLILEGATDATFDGEPYRLEVGDVAWAGAGCVHSFAAADGAPVRWLETQAPQPPARHSYRFARDWDYLDAALAPGSGGAGHPADPGGAAGAADTSAGTPGATPTAGGGA